MVPKLTGQEWLELQRLRLEAAKAVGLEALIQFLGGTAEVKEYGEIPPVVVANETKQSQRRKLPQTKALAMTKRGTSPAERRTRKDRPKRFPAELKERTLDLLRHGLNVLAVMSALQSESPPGTRIPTRFTIDLWTKAAGIKPPRSARGKPKRTSDDAVPVEEEVVGTETSSPDVGAHGRAPEETIESTKEDIGEPDPEMPSSMLPCLREQIPQILPESCLEWQARWRGGAVDPNKAWEKIRPCRLCPQWMPKVADLPMKEDPSRPEITPRSATEGW